MRKVGRRRLPTSGIASAPNIKTNDGDKNELNIFVTFFDYVIVIGVWTLDYQAKNFR